MNEWQTQYHDLPNETNSYNSYKIKEQCSSKGTNLSLCKYTLPSRKLFQKSKKEMKMPGEKKIQVPEFPTKT